MKMPVLSTKILQTRPNAMPVLPTVKPMVYARLPPEPINAETVCDVYYLDGFQWQKVTIILAELPKFMPELPLVLLLSPHHAPMLSVKLPVSRRAQQRQALPFLLEENIADDIENLHFVMANQPLENGLSLVAYVNKTEFDTLLKSFQLHKRRLHAVVPALLMLPKTDAQTWLAWSDERHTLVRQSAYEGFICKNERLAEWLGTQKNIINNQALQLSLQGNPPTWLAPSVRDVGIAVLPLPAKNNFIFVPPENQNYALNLLANSSQKLDIVRYIQPWRWAIGLGIFCFGLVCFQKILANRQLQNDINIINTQNTQMVQAWFPEMRRIFDLETQVKSELKKLPKTRPDVLHILAEMANILPSGTQVILLKWDEKTLNMKFSFGDEMAAQTAKQRLDLLQTLPQLSNVKLNIIVQDNQIILNGFFQ